GVAGARGAWGGGAGGGGGGRGRRQSRPPASPRIQVVVNRPSGLWSAYTLSPPCQPGWAKRTPDGRGGQAPVSKTRPSTGEITDRPSADGRSCMERKGVGTPGPSTPGFVADHR